MTSPDTDRKTFLFVIGGVIIVLVGLLIWAYHLQKDSVPLPQIGYKAAWQPCAPVDTDYYYLEGAESEQVGEIDDQVGCPIEISKYVNFEPVIKHSKI